MSYHKSSKNKSDKTPVKKIPKKISETYLHNSALYYLERFSASKEHFKFVMKRKVRRSCMHHKEQNYDLCAQMVDKLADKFEKTGLLNDDLYTNAMVASLRRKGLSRSFILNKMQAKGINANKTLDALNKLDNDNNQNSDEAEINAALKLAQKKKLGPYFIARKFGEEENKRKSLGVFARAGFSYQIAKNILDMDKEKDIF